MADKTWKFVFSKNIAGRTPIMIVEKFSAIMGKDGKKIVAPDAMQAEDYAEQLAFERGWDLVAVEEI